MCIGFCMNTCTHRDIQYFLQRLMDLVWQIQHLWVFQITTPVSHSSDLSDPSLKPVVSGMKCGVHWEGMFHRNEGLQGKVWKWKKSHDGLHFFGCQKRLGSQPACLEKASFHILVTKFFFLFFSDQLHKNLFICTYFCLLPIRVNVKLVTAQRN